MNKCSICGDESPFEGALCTYCFMEKVQSEDKETYFPELNEMNNIIDEMVFKSKKSIEKLNLLFDKIKKDNENIKQLLKEIE